MRKKRRLRKKDTALLFTQSLSYKVKFFWAAKKLQPMILRCSWQLLLTEALAMVWFHSRQISRYSAVIGCATGGSSMACFCRPGKVAEGQTHCSRHARWMANVTLTRHHSLATWLTFSLIWISLVWTSLPSFSLLPSDLWIIWRCYKRYL